MAEGGEEVTTDYNVDSPESLFCLCVKFCVQDLSTFCTPNSESELYDPCEGLQLPTDVSEALMDLCRERGILNESLLHAFSDPNKTKIRKLNVSNCAITDSTLRWFLPHGLTELDISNCSQSITTESLACINKHGDNLKKLLVGNSWGLFVDIRHSTEDSILPERQFLKCPRLKAFSVHGIYDLAITAKELLAKLLQSKSSLSYLDLSSCQVEVEIMHYLEDMQQLTKLILYDVPIRDLVVTVKVLRKLRNLRALDLSQCKDGPVLYKEPENQLRELVSGLPYLHWLDIAGTNLAGFLSPIHTSHKPEKQSSDDSDSSNVRCAIPGLEGRQFQFLGLMDCPHEACERENIPAEQITGNATEEQIYLSVHVYVEKPVQLSRALNHLFSLFRFLPVRQLEQALRAVLLAMEKHQYNSQIQTIGCACLVFVIKKGEREKLFNRQAKQNIINALLNAMDKHRRVLVLVKRACVALSYFAIPDDLLYTYERMVQLMLWFVEHSTDDQLRQICLHHLKFLSSQVEIHHKKITGNLGGISVMMNNIKRIVQAGFDCDQIMLRSWSILWSLTDMAPVNCEKFLIGGGIDLFLDCCYTYPDDDSLMKGMVGMLCNVAEVPWLRPALMENDKFIGKLVEFMDENLTISNSAAGVLAHLVADDPESWTVEKPSRETVKNRLRDTVNNWDLESRRNVRYRSFVPMLTLFSAYDTPESQHWATWEVCNMIIKDRDRYIKMFTEEGGVQLVEKLLEDPRPYEEIKVLGRELLDMCRAHNPLAELEV